MARRRKRNGRPVSGWLLIDKPVDCGSTEAVARVRNLFGAQKAGHAGTLDPLASGLLPIALGEATKTVPYVMNGRKVYRFTAIWGEERAGDDLEGKAIRASPTRPGEASIAALLPAYTGVIEQTPPQFSAVKIGGNRAYDLAREGEIVDIPPREVEIHRFNLLARPDEHRAVFEVECGKGTYVRALARDIGRDLGCLGHIGALRRTFVAPFGEENLVPLAGLEALARIDDEAERFAALDAHLLETGAALAMLPPLEVSERQARRLRLGNPILLRGHGPPLAADEACARAHGRLVAIGAIAQGEFHPRRVFGGHRAK